MSTIPNHFRWTLLAIPLLLLIPLVAMLFTDQVNWSLTDFVVMGLMLLGTVLAIEFVRRKVAKKYRIWLILAAVLAFLLLWAELAVGIFGSSFAGS